MPGSGKSTCGVLLSKILCKSFVDTDLVIQEREGMRLQQIINEKGAGGFAEIENDIVSSLRYENTVIATGGSVVCHENAMKNLAHNAVIVYLKISYEGMMERIHDLGSRGILLKDGESMRDMYEFRRPLYEKYAQITVDCEETEIGKNVDRIRDELEKMD
jgi:shikimate kinase